MSRGSGFGAYAPTQADLGKQECVMSDSSTFLQLADRCEREEPSRELDTAIGSAVGEVVDDFDFALDYTTSIDAAVTLVPEAWIFGEITQYEDRSWYVVLVRSDEEVYGAALTEPPARAAAALRARSALPQVESK